MKYQTGATVIEVLIALMIFAIGVGGMAALQLRSAGMSIDATQRAIVLSKAQELADRMRSNSTAMSVYIGSFSNTSGVYCAVPPTENCADSSDGLAVSCNAAQMATFDLWDVFCRADTGLDGNIIDWTTTVTCTSVACDTALDTVTITTDWISKTADMDQELASSAGSVDDRTIDSLTLSFIP